MSERLKTIKKLDGQVRDQLYWQIREQLYGRLSGQLYWQVYRQFYRLALQISGQQRAKLLGQLRKELGK